MSRLLRAALLALALLAACTPKRDAPPPAQPGGALFGAPELAPGTRVLVERGGQWYPAAVVGRIAADRVLVQYEGYGPEWNETVGLDRVRPQPKAEAASDFRVGEKLLVSAQGRLLLADVVAQTAPDAWRVHYDGYGPEVAENVGPDRMRRPFAGATAHPPGEAAAVDVGGRVLGGRVLAALAADRWLVRFDGFGPEYDQEVTAERFRAAPAEPPAPAATSAAKPAEPPAPAAPAPAAGQKPPVAAKPAPPAKPAAPPVAAAPSGPLKPGEDVLVAHRGAYHLATLVGPGPGGRWIVRYKTSAVGNETSPGSDEEVAADRVSRALSAEKGSQYQPNQNVFVEWHGLYFPARITKADKGQYRVRFDNFGPDADEVLPARRLRPRP